METPMPTDQFDYSHVTTTARVALYDDLKSAPRITEKSLTLEVLVKLIRQIHADILKDSSYNSLDF